MNATAAWYLVSIVTGQFIGPLPSADDCQKAATYLDRNAIVCRQPTVMQACTVDGRAGTYTACPVFDFPRVTIRKETP